MRCVRPGLARRSACSSGHRVPSELRCLAIVVAAPAIEMAAVVSVQSAPESEMAALVSGQSAPETERPLGCPLPIEKRPLPLFFFGRTETSKGRCHWPLAQKFVSRTGSTAKRRMTAGGSAARRPLVRSCSSPARSVRDLNQWGHVTCNGPGAHRPSNFWFVSGWYFGIFFGL